MGFRPPTAATCARTSQPPATHDARTRRAAIAGAGQMLAETPAIWLRPQREVAALVREVDGRTRWTRRAPQGKALLFLTPHLGCFEIAAQFAAQHFPITVLYRAPKLAGSSR